MASVTIEGVPPDTEFPQLPWAFDRALGVGPQRSTLAGQAVRFTYNAGADTGYIWLQHDGLGTDPGAAGHALAELDGAVGLAVDLPAGDNDAQAVAEAIAAAATTHPAITTATARQDGAEWDVDLYGPDLDDDATFAAVGARFDDTPVGGAGQSQGGRLRGLTSSWAGTAADTEFGVDGTIYVPVQLPTDGEIVGAIAYRGSGDASTLRLTAYDGGVAAPVQAAGTPPTNLTRVWDGGASGAGVPDTIELWSAGEDGADAPAAVTAGNWYWIALTCTATAATGSIRGRDSLGGGDLGDFRVGDASRWEFAQNNPNAPLPASWSPAEDLYFTQMIGVGLIVREGTPATGFRHVIRWGYRGAPAAPQSAGLIDDYFVGTRVPSPQLQGLRNIGGAIAFATVGANVRGQVTHWDSYTVDPIPAGDAVAGQDIGEVAPVGADAWTEYLIPTPVAAGPDSSYAAGHVVGHAFWGALNPEINFDFGTEDGAWRIHDGNVEAPLDGGERAFEWEVIDPDVLPQDDPATAGPAEGTDLVDTYNGGGQSFHPGNTPHTFLIFDTPEPTFAEGPAVVEFPAGPIPADVPSSPIEVQQASGSDGLVTLEGQGEDRPWRGERRYVRVGDEFPRLVDAFLDPEDTLSVAGATVTLTLRNVATGQALAGVPQVQTGTPTTTAGVRRIPVTVEWGDADLDGAAGVYHYAYTIDFVDGRTQTVPTRGRGELQVLEGE